MDLTELSASLRAEFDSKTEARERGLAASRSAIRACGNSIRALHRYEVDKAAELIEEAQGLVDATATTLEDHPDMFYAGFVHDAQKELAEAKVTFALITGSDLPDRRSMGISAQAYAKGMAESIGELRRHILDRMRLGEFERCERLLGSMDDIYYVLVSMDYPDGITMGLRRLTDVARSIIERTRGDFTVSAIQSSLRKALERETGSLDQHE